MKEVDTDTTVMRRVTQEDKEEKVIFGHMCMIRINIIAGN